jgi:RimJ/RimL family protein N-acetyltransferase
MLTPVLRTTRLLLDAVTADDTTAVFEYCQDSELQRYVPVPVPYTEATAASYTGEYARSAAEGAGVLWAIRQHGSARLVGVVELVVEPMASAKLGYWLGFPHRGSGIMTEAVTAVIDFAFAPRPDSSRVDEDLSGGGFGLTRLEWQAVVGNVGSARVAQKVGFHFEGTLRRLLVDRNRRVDGWYASLLATDDRHPQPGWPL